MAQRLASLRTRHRADEVQRLRRAVASLAEENEELAYDAEFYRHSHSYMVDRYEQEHEWCVQLRRQLHVLQELYDEEERQYTRHLQFCQQERAAQEAVCSSLRERSQQLEQQVEQLEQQAAQLQQQNAQLQQALQQAQQGEANDSS